jgi:2-keto-4-pentenoate hydratase
MTTDVAQQLWQARVGATKLAKDFPGAPATETEGYAIQAAMIAASGLPLAGWKIGATVEALFAMLGVSQPFLGPLFQRFIHDNGVELPVLPGTSIESEVTVRLQSDLPSRPQPYERAELEAAVAAIYPSFEIVGARFEGALAGAGFRVIADGGANIGTILGPEIGDWGDYDLADHPVKLSINGELVNAGSTAVLLWDHVFDALGWCLQQPSVSPRGLCAGDLIMTGTTTGITPISPGDSAVADFGAMGQVQASFV